MKGGRPPITPEERLSSAKVIREANAWRAAEFAAAHRAVALTNQHVELLWPLLNELTVDNRYDWEEVLRRLLLRLDAGNAHVVRGKRPLARSLAA